MEFIHSLPTEFDGSHNMDDFVMILQKIKDIEDRLAVAKSFTDRSLVVRQLFGKPDPNKPTEVKYWDRLFSAEYKRIFILETNQQDVTIKVANDELEIFKKLADRVNSMETQTQLQI
jgi:hypothetical protein